MDEKPFKRGITGKNTRETENERAKKENFTSKDTQNIKNRLGLSQKATREQVKAELIRLKKKSEATWRALKLTKKDFEDYDVK